MSGPRASSTAPGGRRSSASPCDATVPVGAAVGGRAAGPAIRTRHLPPHHPIERETETMAETDVRVTREEVDRGPAPFGRIAGPVAVAVAAGLTLPAGGNHDIRSVLGVQRRSE